MPRIRLDCSLQHDIGTLQKRANKNTGGSKASPTAPGPRACGPRTRRACAGRRPGARRSGGSATRRPAGRPTPRPACTPGGRHAGSRRTAPAGCPPGGAPAVAKYCVALKVLETTSLQFICLPKHAKHHTLRQQGPSEGVSPPAAASRRPMSVTNKTPYWQGRWRTRWQRGHLRVLAAGAPPPALSSSSCCSTAASLACTAAMAAAAFCPRVALRDGATCPAPMHRPRHVLPSECWQSKAFTHRSQKTLAPVVVCRSVRYGN